MHVNLYAVADCAGLHYGSGLYTEAGALVNHACAPTCAVSLRGLPSPSPSPQPES